MTCSHTLSQMSQFDILPYVFRFARERDGKAHLTWDEYKKYLGMIQVCDFFTCIDSVDLNGTHMNIDCIITRDIGPYKAGQRFDYIGQTGTRYLFYMTNISEDPVFYLDV